MLTSFPYHPLKDANDGRSQMTMETTTWVKVEGKTSIGDKKQYHACTRAKNVSFLPS